VGSKGKGRFRSSRGASGSIARMSSITTLLTALIVKKRVRFSGPASRLTEGRARLSATFNLVRAILLVAESRDAVRAPS
jgi:hypothetical protein